MKEHEVKCSTLFFENVWDGSKQFEIRLNDRNYQVGDTLVQHEWDSKAQEYLGRRTYHNITYITDYKQRPGYVAMAAPLIRREE